MQLEKQTTPQLVELITASVYKDSLITKHYGHMTINKAINSPSPTVSKWVKMEGEDKMVPAISRLFTATSLYFDKPILQDHAEAIVHKLLADYSLSNLKLEDLVVCCKEITMSKNWSITPNKILSHLKEYSERRMDLAAETSLNDHISHKGESSNINERIEKGLKSFKSKCKDVDVTRDYVNKKFK